MNRGKAVFVTQWFPPEPATQATRIALAMQEGGFETTVVTGIPNYPEGEVHPGYRATQISTEQWKGFRVRRSPLYPSHDGNALKRIANYLSWALSATFLSMTYFRRARVSLVYSSPATAAIPAMIARKILGVPYVLIIQDLWPDSVLASGFLSKRMDGVIRAVIGSFTSLAYRQAAHIIVISPGMCDVLEDRGVSRKKMSLVYNAVDTRALTSLTCPHSRTSLGIPEDALLVMYGGNLGVAQDLRTVIQAVANARGERPVHLMFVGSGVERASLRELAMNVAPDRVTFVDPVPRGQMASLMAIADIQLVSLAPDALFDVTMPSKVQGILAMGEPVWVMASGDVADLVRSANSGVVSTPRDVRMATETIEELAELSPGRLFEFGRAGRDFYMRHMEASAVAEQLVRVLEEAAV